MPWLPVSRNEDKGLAHYVVDEIALGFRIPIARQRALAEPDGRRQVIEAIYNALSKRPITYALEPYNADPRVQQIRCPELVLDGAREGTCLDLALLFGGIALGKELAPLLVMLDRHALVAVSLDDDRRTASDRPRRNREGAWVEDGLLHDGDVLRNLIDEGHYLAIECTGFAESAAFPPGVPESADRVGGKLAFSSALSAGRKQLDLKERPFRFAIDLAVLRDSHGFAAYLSGLSSSDEEKLIAVMEARGHLQTADTAGLQRRVIISLARSLKRDVSDFDQAVVELERAVEVALDVIARGERAANDDAFVNTVLARVAEKVRNDNFDAGANAIDGALAELEAKHQRSRIALLEEGVKVDTLRRDAVAVARRIEMIVTVDHPTDRPAWLPEFQARFDEFDADGNGKGINFSLSVAIELARLMAATAHDANERAIALNLLGTALSTLGNRESGTARLEEAVAAYRAMLEELSRDRVPIDWAITQHNLGNALRVIGERGDNEALACALEAYAAALLEFTRDSAPMYWAGTQNSAANVLNVLGQRGDYDALRQAVDGYEAALLEYTRDRTPLEWAMTQNNLGTALGLLGERGDDDALRRAVDAYEAALLERTHDRVPLGWAMTQNNLGNALCLLGERGDDDVLRRAVDAYEAALLERTRDRVPLDWAMTQNNLGNALCVLGERGDDDALRRAVDAYEAALLERTRDRVPLDWAMTQNNLGNALKLLGEHEGKLARLEKAVAAWEACLTVAEMAWPQDSIGLVRARRNDTLAQIARQGLE